MNLENERWLVGMTPGSETKIETCEGATVD